MNAGTPEPFPALQYGTRVRTLDVGGNRVLVGQTLAGDGTAWLSVSLPGGLLSLAVCLLFVRDLNSRSATA